MAAVSVTHLSQVISPHLCSRLCTSQITAAAAKSLQSCLTLCDPIDGIPPGSPVTGILQARTLEWAAISFSKAWKWKVKVKSLSHVRLLATPWTAAHQAPPSMGFSRQEYWSGVSLPSPSQITTFTQSLVLRFVYGRTKTKRLPILLDIVVQGKDQHTCYKLNCSPSQTQVLKSIRVVPQNVTLFGNKVVAYKIC